MWGMYWVGPPPTHSGILGIYKDPNRTVPLVITINGWANLTYIPQICLKMVLLINQTFTLPATR